MRRIPSLALLILAVQGCNSSDGDSTTVPTHTIAFNVKVGEQDFACGKTYEGLGTTGATMEPHDFRFYIHDVKLVTKDGEEVPLELVQDNQWQYENVALLDFANDQGQCDTGSPETNTTVRGTAPTTNEYVGVHFNFGVPADKNHLDAATAPAPLNQTGLWWNWKGGYKYARIDIKTPENDPYFFHMGGTECAEKEDGSYKCDLYNVPTIKIADFDLTKQEVVFRADKLYEGLDLKAKPNMTSDFVAGCMAFAGDQECAPIFSHLGLTFESAEAGPEQTIFVAGAKEGDGT